MFNPFKRKKPHFPTIQEKAVADVLAERARQDEKWGEQNHDPLVWVPILTEEVGEVSKAVLEVLNEYDGEHIGMQIQRLRAYRTEMVQVAAVALSAIEAYDRLTWMTRETGVRYF